MNLSWIVWVLALAGSTAEPAQWWKTFRDPALDVLMARAAENNLDVRTAASRVVEARANAGIARSALLPSLGSNASANRIRGGFSQGVVRVGGGGAPSQPGSFVSPFETNIFQTGFDTRWELDLFGGLRKHLNAAKAETVAAQESYRDVMLVTLAEVARSYMELRGLQQRIAIALKNRDAQRETLELTRARADAGLATVLDVERQAAQLAVTDASVPALESAKTRILYRLSTLVGEKPGALGAELDEAQPLPSAFPEVPAGLPSDLLKRRPDVRRAEAEIAAATARAGAARRDLFPKFVLTGFLGRQSTTLSGLTLGAGNFFGFGPGIQLPIFTGGRIRANIAVQDARLEQAVRAYEGEVLAAVEEAENALAACRYDGERRASLSAAVRSSLLAVDLARELYLAGTGDFLSVLEAQQALYSSENQLVETETALVVDVIALHKALGGGWD